MTGSNEAVEITVSIPEELKQFRPALDASLFYLALGASAPNHTPTSSCKSARMRVSAEALGYLDTAKARFGSQRQAIINALAWVATQDPARQTILKKTIIGQRKEDAKEIS